MVTLIFTQDVKELIFCFIKMVQIDPNTKDKSKETAFQVVAISGQMHFN